jgi:RNA 2',3'-cyclic 3'-phosphodiesterase
MSHPATARLFVALDLPGELREELSSWARLALRGAVHGVRVLDPELLHLTISFLGSRPVQEIEPLSALIESLAQPAIGEASVGAPLWLPLRRPKALAVEVHDDSGALAALHRAVSAQLAAARLDSAAPTRGARRRAFRPHVTVARLRDGAAPRERALAPTPARSFIAQRLVLYRSWLSPEGASYEALAAADTVPAATGG